MSAADVAGEEGAHLLRRPGVLPELLRHAGLQPEGRGATSSCGTARRTGSGCPLPKGKVRVYKADSARQPAVHRRGLDRPHAEGRAGEDQARQRVRRGGRAHAEGLAEDRPRTSTRWSGRSRCATTRPRPQTVTVIEPVPGDWQMLSVHPPLGKGGGPHAQVSRSPCRRKARPSSPIGCGSSSEP